MSLPADLVRRVPVRVRLPLLVYVVSQLILVGWWAAFFPGLMSYDSISYVWHVTTDHWMANHSVPYDGLVWLSLQASGDLWPLTLLQTVAAAAVLAYAADVLHALGVRARWAALAAIAVPVVPPLGTFLIFVWKDVPFTISAVLIFAATGRLIARRGAGGRPGAGADAGARAAAVRAPLVLLAIGFIGLVIFRNNGFLTAAIAAPILIVALAGRRVAVAAVSLSPIALSFVLTGWLYPALSIEGARPSLTYATAYADVAVAYERRPGTFTQTDLALMSRVAPLWQWRAGGANCYDSDWLTHRESFDNTAADANTTQLRALWMRTIERTPGVVAAARLCRGSIAWRIPPGPRRLDGDTQVAATQVPDDRFGWARRPTSRMSGNPYLPVLRIRPLSEGLHKPALEALRAARTPSLEWLLQRAPLWCYLAYISAAAYAWVRRRPGALALVAPVAGIQLAVLAANPAQLFRYMTGALLVGVLMVPLLTVRRDRRPPDGPGEDAPGEETGGAQPREGRVFAG
ncbi:MAG TPA: hypothetical protein VFU43_05245 [Streptosporangiaceae bacterium]|nr:hypothetical protein [Streptosporangiaceae bacterium]